MSPTTEMKERRIYPRLHFEGGRGEAFRMDDNYVLDELDHRAAVTNDDMRGNLVPVSWKRQLRSFLAVPFMVTVTIPSVLVILFGPAKVSQQKWGLLTPVIMVLGSASAMMGLALMISTIWLFASMGKGTLAPRDPAESLVIWGPYRFVRNPMIRGVLFLLLDEALI